MKMQGMYDSYKQTLMRFVGPVIRDENEAEELIEEIISSKKPVSVYPLTIQR